MVHVFDMRRMMRHWRGDGDVMSMSISYMCGRIIKVHEDGGGMKKIK